MSGKIAILWRGDPAARAEATPNNNRFHKIFDELESHGINAEPAVYCEEMHDEVRSQLLGADGVLVWVNPLQDGRTREKLDALLREVATPTRFVSAHPDTILKMGVKEVVHQTRHLGWGTDTQLYRTVEDFRERFPTQLRLGTRVLKQNRGNDGQGVWKVEWQQHGNSLPTVALLEARRGSMPITIPLENFMAGCEIYFGWGGCIVDQPYQVRLPDGMIRCYVGVDKVVGFGHQKIKALIPPPLEGPDSPEARPGPRIMSGAEDAQFQALRRSMENEWVPQMADVLNIERSALPIIWDADFLYGPRDETGEDTYVLCEINVSSVFAVPDQAPAAIARLTLDRLKGVIN
jgi:hypothetical protein